MNKVTHDGGVREVSACLSMGRGSRCEKTPGLETNRRIEPQRRGQSSDEEAAHKVQLGRPQIRGKKCPTRRESDAHILIAAGGARANSDANNGGGAAFGSRLPREATQAAAGTGPGSGAAAGTNGSRQQEGGDGSGNTDTLCNLRRQLQHKFPRGTPWRVRRVFRLRSRRTTPVGDRRQFRIQEAPAPAWFPLGVSRIHPAGRGSGFRASDLEQLDEPTQPPRQQLCPHNLTAHLTMCPSYPDS